MWLRLKRDQTFLSPPWEGLSPAGAFGANEVSCSINLAAHVGQRLGCHLPSGLLITDLLITGFGNTGFPPLIGRGRWLIKSKIAMCLKKGSAVPRADPGRVRVKKENVNGGCW